MKKHNQTGEIAIGVRHFCNLMKSNIMNMCASKGTDRTNQVGDYASGWSTSEQGFVDQHGQFYTREEAFRIAFANGQIINHCGGDITNGGTLYSENLY